MQLPSLNYLFDTDACISLLDDRVSSYHVVAVPPEETAFEQAFQPLHTRYA